MPPEPVEKVKEKVAKRPTEALAGVALAATVYGFLAESGVPNVAAAIVGAVVGFGPAFVSDIVDRVRR
jgi:hypothetical protein